MPQSVPELARTGKATHPLVAHPCPLVVDSHPGKHPGPGERCAGTAGVDESISRAFQRAGRVPAVHVAGRRAPAACGIGPSPFGGPESAVGGRGRSRAEFHLAPGDPVGTGRADVLARLCEAPAGCALGRRRARMRNGAGHHHGRVVPGPVVVEHSGRTGPPPSRDPVLAAT